MNPVRWLALKLANFATPNTAPRRGMLAFVADYLANFLWTIDTTWRTLIKEGYGKNAVAYACIRILCQGIAEARLTAYDSEDKEKRQELPANHPLRLLLKHPNELLTEYEMIEFVTIHVAVVGRSVWWKERSNGGQVIGYWPLKPDRVGPIYSVSDKPGEKVLWGYAYLPPDYAQPIALPRRDCLAFNFPDPDGETGGMVEGFGPLSALSRQIAADNTATDHVGNLLANYAQPGIALEMDDSPTPEEAAIIKAKFRQEFGGNRIGVPAIVGAGTKITPLGFSLKDLEFPGLRANAEARICAAMGVPAILAGVYVGLHESNQRATTKELREYFTETTLSAYWRRYADQFTLELAAEFGEGLVVEFDTSEVKALAGQFAEKLTPWKEAFVAGVLTVNGYREKLGIDLLPPEVGDVLYVPNTVTVVAVTPEAKRVLDERAGEAMARQQEMAAAQKPKQLPAGSDEDGEEGQELSAKKSVALKESTPSLPDEDDEAGWEQWIQESQERLAETKALKARPPYDYQERLQRVQYQFRQRVGSLSEQLRAGNIKLTDWAYKSQIEIMRTVTDGYILGKAQAGGVAPSGVKLTALDRKAISKGVKEQLDYFSGFRKAVTDMGDNLTSAIDARSKLYAGSARSAMSQAMLAGEVERRLQWHREKEDSCSTCIGMEGKIKSAAEWQAGGVLPSSGTICDGNCGCTLIPAGDKS